jgi:hypothetical protein
MVKIVSDCYPHYIPSLVRALPTLVMKLDPDTADAPQRSEFPISSTNRLRQRPRIWRSLGAPWRNLDCVK